MPKKKENIQKRAARFALNLYHQTASVTDMLLKLKWPTFQKHRQAAGVTMLYKVANDQKSTNR